MRKIEDFDVFCTFFAFFIGKKVKGGGGCETNLNHTKLPNAENRNFFQDRKLKFRMRVPFDIS